MDGNSTVDANSLALSSCDSLQSQAAVASVLQAASSRGSQAIVLSIQVSYVLESTRGDVFRRGQWIRRRLQQRGRDRRRRARDDDKQRLSSFLMNLIRGEFGDLDPRAV